MDRGDDLHLSGFLSFLFGEKKEKKKEIWYNNRELASRRPRNARGDSGGCRAAASGRRTSLASLR
jgi:hypothetical protein